MIKREKEKRDKENSITTFSLNMQINWVEFELNFELGFDGSRI